MAIEYGVEIGGSNDDKREEKNNRESDQAILDYEEWEKNNKEK
jgi:hypothetical protein